MNIIKEGYTHGKLYPCPHRVNTISVKDKVWQRTLQEIAKIDYDYYLQVVHEEGYSGMNVKTKGWGEEDPSAHNYRKIIEEHQPYFVT